MSREDDEEVVRIREELKRERSKRKGQYDIYQVARRVQILRCRGVSEPFYAHEMRMLHDALMKERQLYQITSHIRIREEQPHTVVIKCPEGKPHPGYMIARLLLLIHFLMPLCDLSFAAEDYPAMYEAAADCRSRNDQNGLDSLREAVSLLCTETELKKLQW